MNEITDLGYSEIQFSIWVPVCLGGPYCIPEDGRHQIPPKVLVLVYQTSGRHIRNELR